MADLLLATNGDTYHAPTEAFLRGHLTCADYGIETHVHLREVVDG